MVFSSYKKQRILYLNSKGLKAPAIARILREEGMEASRVGIYKFLKKFEESGCLMRKPGSGRTSKITDEVKRVVEGQMGLDEEATAYQLHALLNSKGYCLSLTTILRCRTSLGWTCRGNAYCQLIREVNKQKRLTWAQQFKNDVFNDVVYTDECTVQMESHRRLCCWKQGEVPQPKPRFVLVCVFVFFLLTT